MMDKRVQGVVIGVVTDVEDPEGLGRIRVNFPWLSPDNASNWARVAVPLASAEKGLFFQPEIGDEALVAFEHGDARFPYIVGYLWNGSNAPPESDQKKRTLQTISGHQVVVDDTSGSEAIEIEDARGNKITMNADGITIESAGDVTIKGLNVNIEAQAQLTAKGTPIHLNP